MAVLKSDSTFKFVRLCYVKVNMILARRLPRTLHSFKRVRCFCNTLTNEQVLTSSVPPFCNIKINLPFHVNISPLDVHKHQNNDKILINTNNTLFSNIKHSQKGNNIEIYSENIQNNDLKQVCNLKIPVKTNVEILAEGHISADSCSGSHLILFSQTGNININKFQGEKIELSTHKGDITIKGAVLASDFKATIATKGSISTGRIQALKALFNVKHGNISVDSSYCDDSTFEVETGRLTLLNIHKKAKIRVQNGDLLMTGFDGELHAEIINGNAEIQISRILGTSSIRVSDNLILKLAEDCQTNTMFEIRSQNQKVHPSLKLILSKNADTLFLTPQSDEFQEVSVQCGSVDVQSASWADMFQASLKKTG